VRCIRLTTITPQGFSVCGKLPDFGRVQEDRYWQAWRVLREYAASLTPSPPRNFGRQFPDWNWKIMPTRFEPSAMSGIRHMGSGGGMAPHD
jgi:hypothetical protein